MMKEEKKLRKSENMKELSYLHLEQFLFEQSENLTDTYNQQKKKQHVLYA